MPPLHEEIVTPASLKPAERELVYIGPALEDGRIDLRLLSEALDGFGSLTQRSSSILYGQTYDHNAELTSSFEAGSVIVPVDIVSHGLKAVESGARAGETFLLSPAVQATVNLCTLLGVGAISIAAGVFRMFKTQKGRPLDPTTQDFLLRNLELETELKRYIRLFNDAEIRSAVRKTLRPLRHDGILEFQTRYRGRVIESVSKKDLLDADEAELSDVVEYEERWLDIQKVALVQRLAWHFAGEGQTFDAKIEDENFWKSVDDGERYGSRDRLRVVLRTKASHDSAGKLHVEFLVTEVLEVSHFRRESQSDLFPDDPRR